MAKHTIDSFFDALDNVVDSAEKILPQDQPDNREDEEPNDPVVAGTSISRRRYLLVGGQAPWHIVRASDNLVMVSGMDYKIVNDVCQLMNRHHGT